MQGKQLSGTTGNEHRPKSYETLKSRTRLCAGETAIRLAGEFTWDEGAPASLVDIDLAIPAGALVAVVGQTGSGKSSLLGAALGLMKQVQGPPVEVHGKVCTRPCDRQSDGYRVLDFRV